MFRVRVVLNLMIALASLLGTSQVVMRVADRYAPPRRVDIKTDKVDHLREHASDYDVIIVGTSHLYRGVDPRAFEARLAELGRPARVYNAAVQNLTPGETAQIVQIIAEAPRAPSLVLIETPWMFTGPFFDFTERLLDGTDAVSRDYSLGLIWTTDWSLVRKCAFTYPVMYASTYRWTAAGEFSRLIWPPVAPSLDRAALWDRGHVSLEKEATIDPSIDARRDYYLRVDKPPARRRVARWLVEGPRPLPALPKAHIDRLEAVADPLRRRGTAVMLVTPPSQRGTTHQRRVSASHAKGWVRLPYLDFSDPRDHRTLYDEHNWFDRGHLSEAGATAFSRLLADRAAAALAERDRAGGDTAGGARR